MIGSLRFFRALLAWLAIVAYVAPVVAHGATYTHAHALAPSCHHESSDHVASADAPATPEVMPADTDDARGAKPGPSSMCCVAMCAPALPSPALVGIWSPQVRVASDSPVVEGVVAAFVTRLDRPPKAGVLPIG
jgi:hypothetical protein